MSGDFNMTEYMTAIMAMIPGDAGNVPIPDMGRWTFTGDLGGGRASMAMAMGKEDLTAMMASFKRMKPAAAGPVGTAAVVKEEPAPVPETPKVLPKEQDPAYWMEKGGLLTTYGYDKAAVNAYKKAAALDPADPAAFFNLGVSYGQIGQYQNALNAMGKAIALDPQKGLYYYGRGRVYLLQGDPLKGVADIQTAAELGSEDARAYLEKNP
jgi:Flp pilus assembly protein TadD